MIGLVASALKEKQVGENMPNDIANKRPRLHRTEIADIRANARRLAEKYNVDTERIFNVLEKIAEWAGPDPMLDDDVPRVPYDTRWRPLPYELSLERAMDVIGYSDAMQLFETNRLDDLAAGAAFVRFLNHEDTPLYSLAELGELAESFAHYLRDEEEAIVNTGFPARGFWKSYWIENRLSRLYYTKYPVGIDREESDPYYVFAVPTGNALHEDMSPRGREITSTTSLVTHLYRSKCGRSVKVYLEQAGTQLVVPYEAESHMLCLSTEDIEYLESARKKLLRMKLAVLKVLGKTDYMTANRLWDECLAIITDHDTMSADDVRRLLAIEKKYDDLNIRTGKWDERMPSFLPPGGLGNVFAMIGHYMKELEVGTCQKLREDAERIEHCFEGGSRLVVSDYFTQEKNGRSDRMRKSIESLDTAVFLERRFWIDYWERVNTAIAGQFGQKGTISFI
ncbi:MAG: hypothetical protein ACYC08_08180, partial [Armatimonadota bacterium]